MTREEKRLQSIEYYLKTRTPSQIKKYYRTPKEKEKDRLEKYNQRLEKAAEKYRTDKKFREKAKKTYRERYQNDTKYQKKTLERAKNRYHTDPEYRKATIAASRKRWLKIKKERKNK